MDMNNKHDINSLQKTDNSCCLSFEEYKMNHVQEAYDLISQITESLIDTCNSCIVTSEVIVYDAISKMLEYIQANDMASYGMEIINSLGIDIPEKNYYSDSSVIKGVFSKINFKLSLSDFIGILGILITVFPLIVPSKTDKLLEEQNELLKNKIKYYLIL